MLSDSICYSITFDDDLPFLRATTNHCNLNTTTLVSFIFKHVARGNMVLRS